MGRRSPAVVIAIETPSPKPCGILLDHATPRGGFWGDNASDVGASGALPGDGEHEAYVPMNAGRVSREARRKSGDEA